MKAASLSGDVRIPRFARCWAEPVSARKLACLVRIQNTSRFVSAVSLCT